MVKRQEVVLHGKVYDLGVKGVDDALHSPNLKLQTMELEVGPTVFQVGVLRQERAVALNWTGMTNVRNVIWQRFLLLRAAWPPVRALSWFNLVEEDI